MIRLINKHGDCCIDLFIIFSAVKKNDNFQSECFECVCKNCLGTNNPCFVSKLRKKYTPVHPILLYQIEVSGYTFHRCYPDVFLSFTGSYFVTEDDLRDFGNLKIDSVARSIKTILRHCKRMREVRAGKITRIVYIDSY